MDPLNSGQRGGADGFEHQVRRTLLERSAVPGLDGPTLEAIHLGARRRVLRRRAAVGGLASVAVLAGIVVGVQSLHPSEAPAPPAVVATSSSPGPSPSTSHSPSPSPASPAPSGTPSATPPGSVVSPPSGGPVPAGFSARSVTALDERTWWVLGDAPCSSPVCTSVVRTSDGGRSFVGIPAPRVALAAQADTSSDRIRDLRFGSPLDGWAFGPALLSTHDGGATWRRQTLPGRVDLLEVDGARAWAVVNTNGTGTLWTTPISSDTWRPVSGAGHLVRASDLAAAGGWVYVLTQQVSGGGPYGVLVTVAPDGSVARRESPCVANLTGTLSASASSVWAACATGTAGTVLRSPSGGGAFAPVTIGMASNGVRVGAIDATTAVIGDQDGTLRRIVGNRVSPVVHVGSTGWRFVGFTDARVGYALSQPDAAGNAVLYRSTDGGTTFAPVRYRG